MKKLKTVKYKLPRGYLPTGRTGLKVDKGVMYFEVEVVEQSLALLLKESIKK